jgi:hypothetical protein
MMVTIFLFKKVFEIDSLKYSERTSLKYSEIDSLKIRKS